MGRVRSGAEVRTWIEILIGFGPSRANPIHAKHNPNFQVKTESETQNRFCLAWIHLNFGLGGGNSENQ